MLGVLTGVAIIASIVGVGYLCARLGILGSTAVDVLVRTAFFVATPALIFLVIARSDWRLILTAPMAVAASSALIAALVAITLIVLFARRSPQASTVTAASAIFVNGNNMGLPVATFVIGDPSAVAAVLLLQPLLISTIIIMMLDIFTGGRTSVLHVLLGPLRNPILLGAALGLVVSVTEFEIAPAVLAPIELVAGASIPMVLIAFGVSLRGQVPLAPGTDRRSVAIAIVVKCFVMPLVAWVIAGPVLGLSAALVYAAVIVAALPTGQLIYAYAVRFAAAPLVARDATVLSTLVSAPVMLLIALLLGVPAEA